MNHVPEVVLLGEAEFKAGLNRISKSIIASEYPNHGPGFIIAVKGFFFSIVLRRKNKRKALAVARIIYSNARGIAQTE